MLDAEALLGAVLRGKRARCSSAGRRKGAGWAEQFLASLNHCEWAVGTIASLPRTRRLEWQAFIRLSVRGRWSASRPASSAARVASNASSCTNTVQRSM